MYDDSIMSWIRGVGIPSESECDGSCVSACCIGIEVDIKTNGGIERAPMTNDSGSGRSLLTIRRGGAYDACMGDRERENVGGGSLECVGGEDGVAWSECAGGYL